MKQMRFQGGALPCESTRTRRHVRWALTALGLATLAACGGGGGSASTHSAKITPSASLSGVAVDGYLQGATVFLDLNRDGQLTAGEPSTLTDASGRYTLDTSALTLPLDGLKVVVTGGVDSDTGFDFTGRLVARVEDASTAQVVTPLTTLLDAMVAAGQAPDVATARTQVANALGFSTSEVAADPLTLLNSKPAIYAAQVSLQRAVEMLAAAQATPTQEPEQAQEQVMAALAQVVAAQSSKGSVKVGALLDQVSTTATETERQAAKQFAESLHDAVELALKDSDRAQGRAKSKAVLKAMDQVRRKAERSDDYDLDKHAKAVDASLGLTASAPVATLVSSGSSSTTSSSTTTAALTSASTALKSQYSITANAQPTNTAGRLLASNCFQCHGTGGGGGFDNIRGGEASEVKEFLRKTASADIMAAHAQGYTTAQLNSIIAYLQQR
jgi:hypothetical protein